MVVKILRFAAFVFGLGASGISAVAPVWAQEAAPAKELFGAIKLPSKGPANSTGFYAKGCLAGAVAIPADGPTWQAIHLSRNRRWGHPDLVAMLERLSREAAAKDGWPGILIGDMSQPRGGPMLNGHASHQVGLDADIWLTPMPDHKMTYAERENIAEYSMLKKDSLYVDPRRWTQAHANLIMRAASYPQVERIFVHPGIKKKLCDSWKGDRSNLGKVRPYYGHFYHFHIRMHCPKGTAGCVAQAPVPYGDGCGKQLAWWLSDKPWAKPKKSANDKPKVPVKPRFIKISDLPKACTVVLNAPATGSEMQAMMPSSQTAFAEEPEDKADSALASVPASFLVLPDNGPVPLPRPAVQ